MVADQRFYNCSVGDVAFYCHGALVDRPVMTGLVSIEHHDRSAIVEQSQHGVAADKPDATSYEDGRSRHPVFHSPVTPASTRVGRDHPPSAQRLWS